MLTTATHNSLILFFISGLMLSFVICLLTIEFAARYRLWSSVDFRRKNTQRVALLGGLAIYLSSAGVSYFGDLSTFNIIFLSAIPLIISGVIDDIYELSARNKFFGQLFSVGIFLALTPTNNILLHALGWPPALAFGFTGFWMLGLINALNMLDGMDGEAAGFSIIALVGISFLPWHDESTLAVSAIVGAVSGFLLLNFQPAKIYLGDSGSTFLGFLLSGLCVTGKFNEAAPISILAPLFIMAVPEIDAVLAMWRRFTLGSSPFAGDHDHIHHKLLKIGLTVRQAFSIICFATIACVMTAIFSIQIETPHLKFLVLLLNIVFLMSSLGFVYYMEHRQGYLMSFYGRTLIEQNLRYVGQRPVDLKSYRATVYDLLPYYKELQKDGILAVQAFTQDYARFIEVVHGSNSGVVMLSNYALLCTESPRSSLLVTEDKISEEFYKLLANHKLQKNSGGRPWGLDFYSDQYKSQEFIKRFRPLNTSVSPVESKRSA